MFKALTELIRLYKLLLSQKRAETFPGRSQTASRIRTIARDYNVDPDLAVKVAECESNLNPKAININANGTIDRGLYQWNDYWHPEITDKCAFDIECSTRAFCQAVKDGHLNWWDSSRHCWT